VLTNTSGFIYYVSVTASRRGRGPMRRRCSRRSTGSAAHRPAGPSLRHSHPDAAAAIARIADAAVVGSAIVEEIRHSLHAEAADVATVESPLALSGAWPKASAGRAEAGPHSVLRPVAPVGQGRGRFPFNCATMAGSSGERLRFQPLPQD